MSLASVAVLDAFVREHMGAIVIWLAVAVAIWKLDFKPRRGK